MNKLAKKLLTENDSYVDALEKAIAIWRGTQDDGEKRSSLAAIGQIGQEIHRMNKTLGVR